VRHCAASETTLDPAVPGTKHATCWAKPADGLARVAIWTREGSRLKMRMAPIDLTNGASGWTQHVSIELNDENTWTGAVAFDPATSSALAAVGGTQGLLTVQYGPRPGQAADGFAVSTSSLSLIQGTQSSPCEREFAA